MVLISYTTLMLSYANIFIALFIAIYAWLFLKKTNEHKDRRPWDFLFVASIFYLLFQILNLLYLNGMTSLVSESVDMDVIRNLFSFLYSGCVLLAFVSQHDLILRSELILISKKEPNTPSKENEKKEVLTTSSTQAKENAAANVASNTTAQHATTHKYRR